MNWRFVGYAMAPYLLVWLGAWYLGVASAVYGLPPDWRVLVATALLFSPLAIMFGLIAWSGDKAR